MALHTITITCSEFTGPERKISRTMWISGQFFRVHYTDNTMHNPLKEKDTKAVQIAILQQQTISHRTYSYLAYSDNNIIRQTILIVNSCLRTIARRFCCLACHQLRWYEVYLHRNGISTIICGDAVCNHITMPLIGVLYHFLWYFR